MVPLDAIERQGCARGTELRGARSACGATLRQWPPETLGLELGVVPTSDVHKKRHHTAEIFVLSDCIIGISLSVHCGAAELPC